MRVAFANERGGAGRTACALLLTLGLVELGRRVTYAELKFGDVPSPAFPADGLPFDYKPIEVRSIDHLFGALHELHVDTPPSTDLILDLPAVSLTPSWRNVELVDRADIFVVPFRRGQAEMAAAAQTWSRLRRLLGQTSCTDGRVWMLPVGWTNAASAARAAAACLETPDPPRAEESPVLPWSVPRLTLLHQSWLSDPERIADLTVIIDTPQVLAMAITRLAAQPNRRTFDLEGLLGGPGGFDLELLRRDRRPMSVRAIEAAEDVSWIECGNRPTAQDLADAPVLHDWRFHSIRSAVLEGVVVGHPSLRDGPVRTSMLFYYDKELSFARTLSRYYRLGRPAGEREM